MHHYPLHAGTLFRRRIGTVRAVDGIDLELRAGETLALVGESGCGKSTTLRRILELVPPDEGRIAVLGRDVGELRGNAARKALRRELQVVFQDPSGSLDPRMNVSELIAEPLGAFDVPAAERARRVDELLELVGLEPGHAGRFPQQLSGGQRQRVGIARALALEPRVLLLDEPVSALDVSIRAGIVNLLGTLKATLDLSYLFVAHDLALVRHVADRVAVMYRGTIVETGDVERVYRNPSHPYTRELLAAVPVPDPDVERERRRARRAARPPDDSPHAPAASVADAPSGCPFRERCATRAGLDPSERKRCDDSRPLLRDVAGPSTAPPDTDSIVGHASACHFAGRPTGERAIGTEDRASASSR